MNKQEVADLFKKQHKLSQNGLSAQYENTDLCRAFYNADAMSYQDKIQFTDQSGAKKAAMVHFNKVQSNVDAVVGFQAQNRRKAKYVARLDNSQEQAAYSKSMNAISDYHRETTNADHLETEQDADMMTCGYGAIETDLSYLIGNATRDPNGEIIKIKLDPKVVYWDSACKNKNLIGSRWCGYYTELDLKEALDLFQGSKEGDFEKATIEQSTDSGFVYNPHGGLYNQIKELDQADWVKKDQNLVRVYNHQWMQYETFYRASNPLGEATDPLDAEFIKLKLDMIKESIKADYPIVGVEFRDMFDFDPMAEELVFDDSIKAKLVKELGSLIKPVEFKRECYYTAIVSGSHVFKHFKSITQQGFSIKFKTGVYNDTDQYWVGMVNALMQPQKYYDKSLTELMFTIASNSKGGVLVERDAVEDIADFEKKWAKTNAVIEVNSGGLGKIQEKTRPAVPTGLENIIALSDNAISSAGVDPSFLGDMTEEQSGILYKRRIRQVISKMARYFDSITLYQKEDARLMADLIRVWVQNNKGQVLDIIGDDGQPALLTITESITAPEYSVSIQEAAQTPEDKQQTAAVLGQYGDKLMMSNPQAGQAFYSESLNLLPIDGDIRMRLTKTLQPQEQQADPLQLQQALEQAQAQIAELQNAINQAQIENLNSVTELNRVKMASEQAKAAKTMEEASRTGLENDLVRTGNFDTPNISI